LNIKPLNIKPNVGSERSTRRAVLFPNRRTPMTKSALLGAAALLSAMAATPVTAQEVIYNPGYCAQFYPNANCQNKGPNNPYTGDYQRRNAMRGAYAWGAGPCAQGAEFYRGRDGRRRYCY
jgi:hypothetical protein